MLMQGNRAVAVLEVEEGVVVPPEPIQRPTQLQQAGLVGNHVQQLLIQAQLEEVALLEGDLHLLLVQALDS